MDCRCDKVTYMLCIFKCTLLGDYQRSIINLSNICPCVLKSIRQKVGIFLYPFKICEGYIFDVFDVSVYNS